MGRGCQHLSGRGWERHPTHLLALILLLTLLAGCGLGPGAGTTPSGTPAPVLSLPPQLAGAHVFVADLVTGDLAQLGAKTYHVSRSIHGLGISNDGRWIYVSDVAGS